MTYENIKPRRSAMLVSGKNPEEFADALKSGADMIVIDLEDSVPPDKKDTARREVLALFDGAPSQDKVERIVRINSLRSLEGLADVVAISKCEFFPDALLLPKVNSPAEVTQLDELLSGPQSGIALHVMIETNVGLENCFKIAQAHPRIGALFFGAVDMAAELRVDIGWNAMLYARSRLVHAAAAAGVDLIDVPFLDLGDKEGLRRESEASAELGFTGKGVIDPEDITLINKCFSPGAEEIVRARRIVDAFEQGDGGPVVIDGKMIEKPVLKSMVRILAVAERDRKGGKPR